MGDPVSTMLIGGTILGAVIGSQQKQPNPGSPPPVIQPPAMQSAKTPDQAAVRQRGTNIGDMGGGAITDPNNTLLTGPGGVDNNKLNLGKNVALGA